jgi:hypothetical protein
VKRLVMSTSSQAGTGSVLGSGCISANAHSVGSRRPRRPAAPLSQ